VKLTPELILGFSSTILSGTYDEPAPTPDCHLEWWELCCSKYPRVAIAAPRGHAKSTSITKAFTLASVLFRDRQFVLIISDTYRQATFFLGNIKTELSNNNALRSLFGVKRFLTEREDDIIVEMNDGYQFRIMCLGSEQKIRGLLWHTGKEEKRPDLIIGDDLENDEIVLNDDRREKFRHWVSNEVLPCLSERGIIRIIGTILHMDSQLERWMPKDLSKNSLFSPDGLKISMKKPINGWMGVRYAAHGPGVRFENILWPIKWSKERLNEKQMMYIGEGNPEGYYREYLNRPIDPHHSYFQDKDFLDFDEEDQKSVFEYCPTYLSCDLAISRESRRDWSVFGIGTMGQNGILYIRQVIRERLDPLEIVDTIINLKRIYKFDDMLIGKGTLEKAIGPFLKEKLAQIPNMFINIIPIPEIVDKRQRATSIRGRMRANGVKFDKRKKWYPEFEGELKQFDRGAHDDQVDMMSLFGLYLNQLQMAPTNKEIQEMEWNEENSKDFEEQEFNLGRSQLTGY
jgi:predicted phage terminase large subunit-like protein